MPFLLKKSSKWPPLKGEWIVTTTDGKHSVWMRCPNCGELGKLDDHEIHTDGFVEPSVVCPTPECHFHETVKLDGWPQ